MDLLERMGKVRPVVLRRADPIHPRASYPQKSIRRDVPVRVQSAPRPPSDTAFSGVGRDAAHATPTVWQYQQLAFSEWLSVMGWPFLVPKVPSALVVSMPRGQHNPIRERVNIENAPQRSLGSQVSLGGAQTYSPRYMKLM